MSATLQTLAPKVRIGATYLLIAQITFVLTGYALHIILGRYLGPLEYGLFGVVLYVTNMIRAFVSTGIPMAVTRYVSAEPARAEAIYRAGFRWQLVISLVASALFFIFAAPLASLLGDDRLISLFRWVAPLTLFFGLFFLIVQYYNGLRNYKRQAWLLIQAYFWRAGLAIGLALLGWRVAGAVVGMVLAAAVSWIWAVCLRRKDSVNGTFPASALIRFSTPLIIAAIAQAILVDMDVLFVKRYLSDEAAAGYYTSAKALAQVTTFVFYALSSALYPAVSAAYAADDTKLLRNYIEQTNRLLLFTILPLIAIVVWHAEPILGLFYGTTYLEAALPLRWLTVSFGLFSVFVLHQTILTGCGSPRIPAIMTVILLPIGLVLQRLITPAWNLSGAALATGFTFLLGSAISSGVIWRKYHSSINLSSFAKITIAAVLMVGTEITLSALKIPVALNISLGIAVYLAVTAMVGEWRLMQVRELSARLWNRE